MEVRIRKNESSENLIKRFIRKTKNEKIILEVLERRFYKKPSSVRRHKKLRRKRVAQKLADQQRNK